MNLLLLLAALFTQSAEPMQFTGQWLLAGTYKAPRIDITGVGFNGNDITGPIAVCSGNDGFIIGEKAQFLGTGSRFERMRIAKRGTGGTALKFYAFSKADRPGEIVIRDVKVLGWSDLKGGSTKDLWEHGLIVDGGDLNDVNAAGIRRILLDNVRVAGCLGDSIVLRNVTHVTALHTEVEAGNSGRVPNVIVENSRHLDLRLNVFGEVHLRNCNVATVSGYFQTLRIDAKCRDVVVTGIAGKLVVEPGAPASVKTDGIVIQTK